MASWVPTSCRAKNGDPMQVQGYPGQGAYYYSPRFGVVWVGSDWAPYSQQGFECGGLGAPVKPWEYLTEFAAAGQWFEGGAIYWKYGYWHIVLGDWGQTAGHLTADVGEWPADVDLPPGAADEAPPAPSAPKK